MRLPHRAVSGALAGASQYRAGCELDPSFRWEVRGGGRIGGCLVRGLGHDLASGLPSESWDPIGRLREGMPVIADAYFVYLLASGRNGTSDLMRRVLEHREHAVPGFTKRYGVTRLMWFEAHETLLAARQRERQIKAWKRQWKLNLFRESNPDWDDLYPELTAEGQQPPMARLAAVAPERE